MTATELITLLERMPDDVDIVIPVNGGHADVLAVVYDPERDAVLLLAE
jgi:hypothetical protein